MPSLYTLLGVSYPFDATSRLTTSWLLPPYALALIRLLFALYAFFTLFFIIAWNEVKLRDILNRQSFSYFTVLGYWGLAFYFLFSGLHTLSYARRGVSWLQRWPRPLQAAHVLYYSTVTTFPLLVTIVFWVILYKPPFFPIRFNAWSNISQHALNSLFAIFEIFIPRTSPPAPFHILLITIILAMYLSLAYVTHATEGFYTYGFLDPAQGAGKTAAYIVGVLAAAIIIFGVVWGLIWLRRWLTETVMGMRGKLSWSDRGARREIEDEEMVIVHDK